MRPVAIYLILDESESPRYVGRTFHSNRRPLDHFRKHPDWAKSSRLLEVVPDGVRWQDRERYWIAYYRRFASLENIARGGGSAGPKSPDAIRRQREKVLGRKNTPEQRAKISYGLKGKHAGGRHNKGKVRTEAMRLRMAEISKALWVSGKIKGNTGRRHSEETRLIIGEKSKGRPPNSGSFQKGVPSPKSEAWRLKVSLANRGKTVSAETRRKIREANLGKRASEETKRKMSESQQARFRKAESGL